jgi:hypothetical protein
MEVHGTFFTHTHLNVCTYYTYVCAYEHTTHMYVHMNILHLCLYISYIIIICMYIHIICMYMHIICMYIHIICMYIHIICMYILIICMYIHIFIGTYSFSFTLLITCLASATFSKKCLIFRILLKLYYFGALMYRDASRYFHVYFDLGVHRYIMLYQKTIANQYVCTLAPENLLLDISEKLFVMYYSTL